MSKSRSQPRSSSAAYRQVYYWVYDFDEVLGINPTDEEEITLEILLSKMTIWLGRLYDVAAQSTFEAYYQQLLNYKEMKIFFAACLILHTVRFMQYLENKHNQLWSQYRQDIIKTYDQNSTLTLDFLMMKFPQKQVGSVDPDLEKLVPVVDRTQDPDVEILKCIGIRFTGDNTLQQIKQMMNTLIRVSKQLIVQFRKQMVQIFTLKDDNTQTVLYNLVGMKFRQTVQDFSDKQIKQLGMKIKGPQMLRIMIKWIEQLQKKCKNVDKYIINRYYPFNTKKGQLQKLNYKQKDQLAVRIKQSFENVKSKDKLNVKQINSILFDLFKFITIQKENYKYIQEKQVTVGLFTHILSQSVSNIVSEYLEFLINNICKASEDIDFITFGVSDLLRCKCSGSKKQIKQVYEKLQKKFTIVRVKNRLKTSNNDFLVNFKYKGLTCQCQLGFTIDKKQENKKAYYQNSFSHFLYQMARSKFSPLTEIVIINNHLNQTVGFFQNITKQNNKKGKDRELKDLKITLQKNKIFIDGFSPVKNTFPIFCNYCWEYKGAYESFLDMYVSKQGINVCGQCYISRLSPDKITQYLIGDKLAHFFQKVPLKHLLSFEDFQQYYVILLYKSYNKSINIFCKPKGIEQLCLVFSKFKGKYEFHSPSKLRSISFFAFAVKKQLKLLKQFKQVLQQHTNIDFIQPGMSFDMIKNNRQELLFIQSNTYTLIINNQNTQETKRERYKQLKFQTLIDKNWWLMQSENIDENFFDNPKIIKNLAKVTKLQISDNKLKNIKFLVRNSLVHLNISSNNIIEIDFAEFEFSALKILDLSKNILTTLKLQDCNLNQLETLNATSNKITSFEVRDAQLQALQILKLNNNRLESIQGFRQLELENLEILNLEQNLLVNIEFLTKSQKIVSIKNRLPKLKQLSIQNNKIKEYDGLSQIQSLEQISFGAPDTIDLQKWGKCKLHFLKSISIKNSKKIEGIRIFTKFFSLKTIIIRENNLQNIKLSDLNLKYLQQLTITQNSLEKIQGLNRVTLTKLRELNLVKNKLKSFSFQFGNGFPQLTHLKLQSNQIKTIEHIKQAKAPKLLQLHLQNNKLKNFDLCSLDIFPLLSILDLSNNNLTQISGLVQLNLPNLKVLNLSQNKLRMFGFPSLPNIQIIYLQKNQINFVKYLKQSKCPHLKEVHLNDNQLQLFDIKDMSFSALKILNLNDNQLENITHLKFSRLPQLSSLNLSYNKLKQIDLGGGANFPKLKIVNLESNILTEMIGLNSTKFTSLQKLIVRNNELGAFQFERLDLPELQQLALQNNNIHGYVSFRGAKLPALLNINMEKNKIQKIQFSQSSFPLLSKINLKHNEISQILGLNTSRMQNLIKFQLDNNRLLKLNLSGVILQNLESLDFTNNRLIQVEGFRSCKLQSLKKINFENNKITQFVMQNCSDAFPILEIINLENNQIRKLSFLNSLFPALKMIILKSNHLSDIGDFIDLNVFPKLQTLLVNKNKIRAIDFSLLIKKVEKKDQNNETNLQIQKLKSTDSKQFKHATSWDKKNQLNAPQFSLSQINLDQNQISLIKFSSQDPTSAQSDVLKTLKRLYICHNSLTQLNLTGINTNSNLQTLHINNNKNLFKIQGFDSLIFKQLLELNLQNNALEQLPFSKTMFEKLQSLTLIHNKIHTIDQLKDAKMNSLKVLRLSQNLIKYVNLKCIAFNALIRLDLDDNKIQGIDNLDCAKLPCLQILNLRKNQIKRVDFKGVFMYCLKYLILAQNKLDTVKGFKQARFPNLVSLDLCKNNLKTLDISSDLSMNQLQKLMLHNNKLVELIGVDENKLKMLKIVTINDNPISTQQKYMDLKSRYSNPAFQ